MTQPPPSPWSPANEPTQQYPQSQPTYGQPTYGRPTYSQPSYSQPPYGQSPYAQPTYGRPPATPMHFPPGFLGPDGRPPRRSRAGLVVGTVAAVVIIVAAAVVITLNSSSSPTATGQHTGSTPTFSISDQPAPTISSDDPTPTETRTASPTPSTTETKAPGATITCTQISASPILSDVLPDLMPGGTVPRSLPKPAGTAVPVCTGDFNDDTNDPAVVAAYPQSTIAAYGATLKAAGWTEDPATSTRPAIYDNDNSEYEIDLLVVSGTLVVIYDAG